MSPAYHASPAGVCQSAQEMPVRSSFTPSVARSSSTLSTRSCSPGRNHSSMPIVAAGWRLALEGLGRSFERLKWPLWPLVDFLIPMGQSPKQNALLNRQSLRLQLRPGLGHVVFSLLPLEPLGQLRQPLAELDPGLVPQHAPREPDVGEAVADVADAVLATHLRLDVRLADGLGHLLRHLQHR